MRKVLGLTICLFLSAFSYATHQVGGLITYKCLGGYTYQITVQDYTNTYPIGVADRDTMRIFFGDGNSQLLTRQNGLPNYLLPGDFTPNGEPLCNYDFSKGPNPLNGARKLNIYQTTYTYVGPGSYHVWMEDPDRMSNVTNINGSVNVVYYMYTTININPEVRTCINSPQITNPPVCQYGCTGQCYTYNPGAYIPDLPPGSDDSISYSLGNSLTYNPSDPYGEEVAPGYKNPGAVIDHITGTLSWCNPTSEGIYNFVILMTTYQRSYVTIGNETVKTIIPVDTVELELEVIINSNCVDPSVTSKNICVEAGTTASITYTATIANNGSTRPLYITDAGEPFSLSPPATLSNYGPPAYTLHPVFTWPTTCNDVRVNPYEVVIRATEKIPEGGGSGGTPDTIFYSAYGTSLITVVGPPPGNLKADVEGTSVCLHWNPSICPQVSGYNIYRGLGCISFVRDVCVTGVPSSTGFKLIATNLGLDDTTYCDTNSGAGLSPGAHYSYIVDATYPLPDGSESLASNDTCVLIKYGVPVLTNVSVTTTDPTKGEVFVRWTKPIADSANLDTVQYPPPYTYILQHASGMNGTNFSTIKSIPSPHYNSPIDTTYMDTGIDTQDSSHTYKVDFYSGALRVGSSGTASSIYLKLQREDQSMNLGWSADVPWSNDTFYIYREVPPSAVYSFIAKTTSSTYTDTGLHNGSTYCYYVKSISEYKGSPYIKPYLYDSSETACGIPEDTIAPCSPPLDIAAKCVLYEDSIIWNNPNRFCTKANKVVGYQIFYTPVENGDMYDIANISNPDDTIYVNSNLTSVAGCYAVLAVDSAGQTSPFNTVCVDNCPIYQLPNVFTPNGDGSNDLFTPLEPFRYVKDIDLKVFNRWGQVVFQTTDPTINWNGKVDNSGGACPNGTYYYICVVNEIRLKGIVPVTLKGFIQLIR